VRGYPGAPAQRWLPPLCPVAQEWPIVLPHPAMSLSHPKPALSVLSGHSHCPSEPSSTWQCPARPTGTRTSDGVGAKARPGGHPARDTEGSHCRAMDTALHHDPAPAHQATHLSWPVLSAVVQHSSATGKGAGGPMHSPEMTPAMT